MHSRNFALLCALILTLAASPSDAQPAPTTVPWAAPASTSVLSEARHFTSAGARLSGTLTLPQGAARVPVVVVTHSASSPLRDASLYQHLKTMLPALGIGVFVYDRRGSGESGTETAGGDYALLADDANAAGASLKSHPRVDAARIGTWGLSQGGWISPLAASRSSVFSFVIAVSAPVVTADVQMMFSSINHLRANGHSQAEIEQMAATRTAVDNYMRGRGSKVEAQRLIDLAKTKPWFKYTYMGETVRDREVSGWRKEIENDPLANLTKVEVPTLILYGAYDAVVPVAESVERLKGVAATMPNMKVHVVARADHTMQTELDRAISLDPKNDGTEQPDSAEYVAIMSTWLARQGLTAK